MAYLIVHPATMHRDWDDVIKFAGRFAEYTYDPKPEKWDLTHRKQWATVAPAAGGGSLLDPLHRYVAVKNEGSVPVLLHLNTQANVPNPAFEITILPGHWVEFVDLWMSVQPSVRVDSALYSVAAEVEVLQIGLHTEVGGNPDKFCDLWGVGHKFNDGALTRHHPEATPTGWDAIANPITDVDHWLADVAGVAVVDYWAVGYDMVEAVPNSGLFAKWNGLVWSEEAQESPPPQYGVWGFATDDYWSVGGSWGGDGAIWHYPGGIQWGQDCIPDLGGHRTLYCVHGHDPALIWAAGMSGLIVSTNAPPGNWVICPCDTASHFYGIWAANPLDVWAVGGTAPWWGTPGGAGTIFRQTIMGWMEVPIPEVPTLRAVWGFSDTDVWAVGDAGTILHWDGAMWALIPEPADLQGSFHYRGIFGCKPWSLWAVGTDENDVNVTIYWDGATWQIDDGPNPIEGDLLGLKGCWYTGS